jgi:hypothetical protein
MFYGASGVREPGEVLNFQENTTLRFAADGAGNISQN